MNLVVRGYSWCGGVWCGVVWCGAVWCSVVWCDVLWCVVVWCVVLAWCGVVRSGVVWRGVLWCGVVWCDVLWCGVVWCGVAWCGVAWCGVVRCGVMCCGTDHQELTSLCDSLIHAAAPRDGALAEAGCGGFRVILCCGSPLAGPQYPWQEFGCIMQVQVSLPSSGLVTLFTKQPGFFKNVDTEVKPIPFDRGKKMSLSLLRVKQIRSLTRR